MQGALIYIKPVAEREQVTANGAPRLIINAIICYSKQQVTVGKSLRDLFRGNSLKC